MIELTDDERDDRPVGNLFVGIGEEETFNPLLGGKPFLNLLLDGLLDQAGRDIGPLSENLLLRFSFRLNL